MENQTKVIGYARVSTQDQSLDMQLDALKKFGVEKIYEEKQSGKNMKRKELNEMLKYLRPGDTVVVFKLDRISRSTKDLIQLMEQFESKGIHFVSIHDKIDTSSAMGRFFFRSLASIAELERDITSERTKEGLAAARARGRKGGRPKADSEKVALALKMYDSQDYTLKEIKKATGVSPTSVYRYLAKRK